MRSYDLTAGLCVLALAFSGVGGGGPLLGEERILPFGSSALTIFAWIASPLAFPTIALAILYFPTRSRLARSHAVAACGSTSGGTAPVCASAHDCALSRRRGRGTRTLPSGTRRIRASTTRRSRARWPSTCSPCSRARTATGSITTPTSAAASAWRSTPPSRASSRMPSATASRSSPQLFDMDGPDYRGATRVILDGLVLLPAFGLVYAVGVAHVLGPRVVLRRSLQYALANRIPDGADLPAGHRAGRSRSSRSATARSPRSRPAARRSTRSSSSGRR